jgi:DNA polymerase-3 subunit delta
VGDFVEIMSHSRVDGIVIKTTYRAKVLKVNPYFVKDYEVAFRNYPMKKVSAIVAALRTIDVKSKGVGAASTSQHDLLKELLITIFN